MCRAIGDRDQGAASEVGCWCWQFISTPDRPGSEVIRCTTFYVQATAFDVQAIAVPDLAFSSSARHPSGSVHSTRCFVASDAKIRLR
ncbi:MAG TPA: hypothetical protein DDZ51_03020 [Planctomycetaceae bacterium]|nr:hypothetical protein [Planctomycetaceae bacterium]